MKLLTTFHPTPFCNLDCTYCWAPNRSDTAKMPLSIVEKTFDQVYSNKGIDGIDVLWLTGEPLVLGVPYFRNAVKISLEKCPPGVTPRFVVQTNGTLVNEQWCDFFAEFDFVVGVSVDGPADVHDSQRKSKLGRPSFENVERAIRLLTSHKVRGGAICVITRKTLGLPPDELFAFFNERGIAWSYLLEAAIGENSISETALRLSDAPAIKDYLGRLMDLWADHPESYVRDFEQTSRRIFGGSLPQPDSNNLGCLDILNVSVNGDFFWGNPELMSATLGPLDRIRFNVLKDDIWRSRASPSFKDYQRQVHSGIKKCREQCAFFEGCQGGNPAHKYYEFGSFDVADHTSCMLNDQVIQRLMVEKLGSAPSEASSALPPSVR